VSRGAARRGRKRIAHLGPDAAGRGGMGLSIQGLLVSPLAEVYEMTAITTWRGPAGRVGRVVIFAQALAALVRWSVRPGIVHVHVGVRGSLYRKAVCVAVAKLCRRPVVLQVRVGPWDIANFAATLGPVRLRLFSRTFALADRVLSVSASGAEEIERIFGRRGITVISNPAPEPRHGEPPATDDPMLLYIGGFHDPAKGGDVMLEALPRILSRHPGARIELAGPGDLPEEGRRVVDQHPGVTWLGWLDASAKDDAFTRADVFVLSSRSEGMPNAMLEAMANGRAVVASEVGGVPDIVTDGEDGLLVAPGAPEPLADAACRLLEDRALRARMGAAARARAERLTLDEVWGRLDAVYRELA